MAVNTPKLININSLTDDQSLMSHKIGKKTSTDKCYKGKCYKRNHFRFRLKPGPVCWFRKRSELTFSLLSLGATGEQGISCYSSMALLLLTLASSDLKLPRGCWDTSCHIDDSLFFPLFLCVVCSFVGFFWSKIWWPLLFSSIQADSNLTENTTISSCCKISADEEVRKKKGKKCF